jgi:lipoic acid synthetase
MSQCGVPAKPSKPEWLKIRLRHGQELQNINRLMREQRLATVCEEARCPNLHECWNKGTATFLILGDTCTRSCGFCNIKTGRPGVVDWDEPERVLDAVRKMKLNYVVLTSVDRDELPDKGAGVFALTIHKLKREFPELKVEVLIPDFKGDYSALRLVLQEKPDVLNHNVETAARLYRTVRPQADYQQSLTLLLRAKKNGFYTKSGFMVGIGENDEDIRGIIRDLHAHQVDFITIGQYLQPTAKHLPVDRYVHPDQFDEFARYAREIGVPKVQSGPLVRSSYHADEAFAGQGVLTA